MERKFVESSNLTSIGYDFSSCTLEIEFKSGGVWQYYEFPEHMWNEFEYAESYGKYFHAHIKNQYREARVG